MGTGINYYDLVIFIFTITIIVTYKLGHKYGYDEGYRDGARDRRFAKRKVRRLYGTVNESEVKIREY